VVVDPLSASLGPVPISHGLYRRWIKPHLFHFAQYDALFSNDFLNNIYALTTWNLSDPFALISTYHMIIQAAARIK
jgi:hypothetical protein